MAGGFLVGGGLRESLEDVPPHVWTGLPEDMRLAPSAVNQHRIGVWALQTIPRGKRFGPFVGERKKRSQVTSNVYMWEVYFPTRGWMCVDATDPLKGNWLRYVNWARSAQEQNLFPLEINRAIYYKVLRPIEPGEELLVWYNGEDNPEIAAALQEERASSLSKKNSPRARRARKKLLERERQALKLTATHTPTDPDMRESEEGLNEDESPSLTSGPMKETPSALESVAKATGMPPNTQSAPQHPDPQTSQEPLPGAERSQPPPEADVPPSQTPAPSEPPQAQVEEEEEEEEEEQPVTSHDPQRSCIMGEETPLEGLSSAPKDELDGEQDAEGDLEDDLQGESYPCQHCERRFSTRQGLERHTHIHSLAGGVQQEALSFCCRYCGKSFGSQVGRRRHERRHENTGKKRPGSLAGTASLLSPPPLPDGTGGSAHFITMATQNGAHALNSQDGHRRESLALAGDAERPLVDESAEARELHVCKYCNKAFGTHTNMRRHQRRIHERHLLPKGVRRKGMLMPEATPAVGGVKQPGGGAPQEEDSPRGSPPPVYVPSMDSEDEVERDDGMADISSNISENLSLYIDGKIVSTATTSTCEVIEVNSSSAALFGLDAAAVIISPEQISQALSKAEAAAKQSHTHTLTHTHTHAQLPPGKRRTSTPPLLPSVKVEPDGVSSSASCSSSSSSSSLLLGSVFTPSDSLTHPKEKSVYLSPKLKQLLQTQDGQRASLTLVASDTHTLSHRSSVLPLSVSPLSSTSGRFKRRTGSPPNSPPLTAAPTSEAADTESVAPFVLKVPKLERQSRSPGWGVCAPEDADGKHTHTHAALTDWPSGRSGGSSCNQQPLDLSSTVTWRGSGGGPGVRPLGGEAVLDLSLCRKSSTTVATAAMETDARGNGNPASLAQPPGRKKKPNTSMLEKVLMSDYASLPPGADDPLASPEAAAATSASSPGSAVADGDADITPSPASPASDLLPAESGHSSPPSLTPVTLNVSSPCSPCLASPTPPPPLLPSAPSPPPSSSSCPVLSPKASSPTPPQLTPDPERTGAEEVTHTQLIDPADTHTQLRSEDCDPSSPKSDTLHTPASPRSDHIEPTNAPLPHSPTHKTSSCSGQTDASSLDSHSGSLEERARLSGPAEHKPTEPAWSPSGSSPAGPRTDSPVKITTKHTPAVTPLKHTPPVTPLVLKEEPEGVATEHRGSSVQERAELEVESDSEGDTFAKSFVCNVCEEPFRSITELSRHIVMHAADWPLKCEFCVQLFEGAESLLEHRSALHGVGRIYVCSVCRKEFAFLCNLQQHQRDLHPDQPCTHTVIESGKLRPHNYTDPARAAAEPIIATETTPEPRPPDTGATEPKKEEDEEEKEGGEAQQEEVKEDPTEELYTTIKIMASEAGKPKGPDVRLGINQHYPSFKPPPFPYHNRTPAGSVASATNFTTHNIPQTFSTAIRCTKCGQSFDNMPELHTHILACASASDKRRYTPKKNPIPLRQTVRGVHNGLVSTATAAPSAAVAAANGTLRRMGPSKRLSFGTEPAPAASRMSALSKKKQQLLQKAISQKNRSAASASASSSSAAKRGGAPQEGEEPATPAEVHVCPHCSREFTYPASLSKHIAMSCPMKPAPKRGRKPGSGASAAVEALASSDGKTMSLRRRPADEAKQEVDPAASTRPLGKTRARSSELAEADANLLPRGKGAVTTATTTTAASVRAKRPASLPLAAVVPGNKKGRKSLQTLPPSQTPAPPAPAEEAAERPATKGPKAAKEGAIKRASEGKGALLQGKREERSLRPRERVGGPVTRSLQATAPSAEDRADEPPSQDAREPQDGATRFPR